MSRVIVCIAFLLIPLSALAQDERPGIDIVEVSGPLDASVTKFMAGAISEAAASGQELVVLQINSRAALDRDSLVELVSIVKTPPVPVAIWVGPAPASVFGGVAQLVLAADQRAIAPGAEIGLILPTVAGDHATSPVIDTALIDGYREVVRAEDSAIELQPAIRQYIQDLDGRIFNTDHGPVRVETLEPITQDGQTGVTSKPVTFIEPGLGIRFFRLAVTPESAFFFLAVGLTVVSFEFFAIGPGVAAGVAALSLLIGGWGLANLPVRGWALGLVLVGWGLLTGSYQRGGVIVLTMLGALMLQVGGSFFVDGSGQIDPRWWLVLPSVLAVLFFFLLAMPTVQRARFSTQVLGRESLVGAAGIALTDFDRDGLVEVNGARWRATAHREAGIGIDSPVRVSGVDGLFLEVEPVEDREN